MSLAIASAVDNLRGNGPAMTAMITRAPAFSLHLQAAIPLRAARQVGTEAAMVRARR
jgi:hypothetical protein